MSCMGSRKPRRCSKKKCPALTVESLRPCVCKGKPSRIHIVAFRKRDTFIVRCPRCGMRTAGRFTQEAAIRAWNGR